MGRERRLTVGTEKFPDVGHFKDFIKQHSRSSNASTSMEATAFHFRIPNCAFAEGLDVFSQFFVAPRLDPEYVDKEINAVDSEFSKNINSDAWRAQNLLRTLSSPLSAFNLFSTGNLDTLRVADIHSRLRGFYDQHYRWARPV